MPDYKHNDRPCGECKWWDGEWNCDYPLPPWVLPKSSMFTIDKDRKVDCPCFEEKLDA